MWLREEESLLLLLLLPLLYLYNNAALDSSLQHKFSLSKEIIQTERVPEGVISGASIFFELESRSLLYSHLTEVLLSRAWVFSHKAALQNSSLHLADYKKCISGLPCANSRGTKFSFWMGTFPLLLVFSSQWASLPFSTLCWQLLSMSSTRTSTSGTTEARLWSVMLEMQQFFF